VTSPEQATEDSNAARSSQGHHKDICLRDKKYRGHKASKYSDNTAINCCVRRGAAETHVSKAGAQ